MSRAPITRDAWLRMIANSQASVGECIEWRGPMRGKTPMTYVPAGFFEPGAAKYSCTARPVIWRIETGFAVPEGMLVRMRCLNDHCVAKDHMRLLTRQQQAREQSRRGELQTVRKHVASISARRARSEITPEIVTEIRGSSDSNIALAKRLGVTRQSVYNIRAGKAWVTLAANASAFSWRGAA